MKKHILNVIYYWSIIISLSRQEARKACTLFFHPALSLAAVLVSSQLLHPTLFRSFSTVLLHVIFCFPFALLPFGGVHSQGCQTVIFLLSPYKCSIHFHLLWRILLLMFSPSPTSLTLSFEIFSHHLTLFTPQDPVFLIVGQFP